MRGQKRRARAEEAEESIMVQREACPQCDSTWYKRNGHIHTGKQNHCYKLCGRAFVLSPENHLITEERRLLIRAVALGENLIAWDLPRSEDWAPLALAVYSGTFCRYSRSLACAAVDAPLVILQWLEAEMDELWSFVGKKTNRQWVWIAMDATTRQIIAFHVGDRSQDSAEQLWANIPAVYREQAMFYTDQYVVYRGVLP